MKLQDKVCVITGAASGLGSATARIFASEGACLCLADWDNEGLRQVEDQLVLSHSRDRVVAVAGDISSSVVAEAIVSVAKDTFGRIDVLFNNAAIDPLAPSTVGETTPQEWDRIFSINLRAYFMLCRLCLPLMVEAGQGVIINTGSSAGIKATPGQSAYSVSKAAVIALTRSIASEYSAAGIRANCICPGFLESVMSDRRRDLTGSQLRDRARQVRDKVPMKRAGAYAEAARTVLFLASEDSSYMTGAVVPVDGGWLVV